MFLEKVFNGRNDIGRWFAVMIIVIISFYVIGLIPLGTTMFFRINDNPDLLPDAENSLDFESYGISPGAGLALTLFPFIIGLLALVLLIKPVHERTVLSLLTGNGHFRWKRVITGMVAWFLMLLVYYGIAALLGIQKFHLQFDPGNLVQLIFISLLFLSFQAIFQEILFRGYLLQGFTSLFLNKWTPILLTALLFALFQYFNPQAVAFGKSVILFQWILFGLFLGICVVMEDGLELVLGIQTVNGILNTILFTNQSDAVPTPALFSNVDYNSLISSLYFFLLSIVFLLIAKAKFKWPEWNYLFTKVEKTQTIEETEDSGNFGLFGEVDYDNDES